MPNLNDAGQDSAPPAPNASATKARLDWENYRGKEWCADGDGFYVVRQNSTGFRMFSNNERKYLGKRKTLEEALVAIERYWEQTAPDFFRHMLERYPSAYGAQIQLDEAPQELPQETLLEVTDGNYGSYAYRLHAGWPVWSCQESSDYHYYAVTDDFGNLRQVGLAQNLRGY